MPSIENRGCWPAGLAVVTNVSRAVWTVVLALSVSACGSGSTAPEGYVQACYGGNFAAHLSGKQPMYLATLDINQAQWPRLTETLTSISERHSLRLFNDTRHTDGLDMIVVSLCSEQGLFMTADKRIWSVKDQPKIPELPLTITIYAYRNEQQWRPVIEDVDSTLRSEWAQQLDDKPKLEVRLKDSLL
jgi:hypothetical protein